MVVTNGDSLHLSGAWLCLVTLSSVGISGVDIAISFHGPTDAITGQTPAIYRTRFGPGVGGRTVGARPDKISCFDDWPENMCFSLSDLQTLSSINSKNHYVID